MTVDDQQQLAERAIDCLNVAFRAVNAARKDLRTIGNETASEAAQRLLESVGRVAELSGE